MDKSQPRKSREEMNNGLNAYFGLGAGSDYAEV